MADVYSWIAKMERRDRGLRNALLAAAAVIVFAAFYAGAHGDLTLIAGMVLVWCAASALLVALQRRR